MDDVLYPCKVGVAVGRRAKTPPYVVGEFVGAPVAKVEGWVGHDKVCFESGVAVVEKGVGVVLPEVGLDTPDGEVHLCHFPRGGVAVLPVDRDAVDVSLVAFDEVRRLYKHAARATARVVYAAVIGLQYFDQCANNAGRRVELTCELAFCFGKF